MLYASIETSFFLNFVYMVLTQQTTNYIIIVYIICVRRSFYETKNRREFIKMEK